MDEDVGCKAANKNTEEGGNITILTCHFLVTGCWNSPVELVTALTVNIIY